MVILAKLCLSVHAYIAIKFMTICRKAEVAKACISIFGRIRLGVVEIFALANFSTDVHKDAGLSPLLFYDKK